MRRFVCSIVVVYVSCDVLIMLLAVVDFSQIATSILTSAFLLHVGISCRTNGTVCLLAVVDVVAIAAVAVVVVVTSVVGFVVLGNSPSRGRQRRWH